MVAPLTLVGPLSGSVIMPGQTVQLSWQGGQGLGRVSINATYEKDGATVVETVANVANTGFWAWQSPVDFSSRQVTLTVTENDLIVSGSSAESAPFTVGQFAALPDAEAGSSLKPGLVQVEDGTYYYVTTVGTLRPFTTWEIADTYNRSTALLVTRAAISDLPLGRPMLPAVGSFVSFASLDHAWRVELKDGQEALVKTDRVPAGTKVFPLPDTMAWALR